MADDKVTISRITMGDLVDQADKTRHEPDQAYRFDLGAAGFRVFEDSGKGSGIYSDDLDQSYWNRGYAADGYVEDEYTEYYWNRGYNLEYVEAPIT